MLPPAEPLMMRKSVRERGIIVSFFQSSFLRDRHNRYPLLIAFAIHSILWVIVFIKLREKAGPIPLHFNVLSGIEFTGSPKFLLRLPLIGLVLLAVNASLGYAIYSREKFLGTLLCYGSLIVQVELLAALVSIMVLNA